MGFIARLTTYLAGTVPRIKAADLNAMQDAIAEIITGAITLKTLHVKYGDPNNTAAPGNFGIYVQTSGGHGGIRAESDSWLGSLAVGQYPTIRSQLTETKLRFYDAVATLRSELSDSKLRFVDTVASGSNPTKTTALPNSLSALLVPKAWCYFTTDGSGGITYEDGGAITSVAILSNTEIEVTFATPFDNAQYAVSHPHGYTVGGAVAASMKPADRGTTSCKITYGTNVNTTAMAASLIFFGRQTT